MNADSFDIDDVAFCSSVQSPSADDGAVRPQVSTGTTRGGALFGGGEGGASESLAANANRVSWISQQAYGTLQTVGQATARIKEEESAASEEQQRDAKYQLRSRREGAQKPQSQAGPTQGGKKKSAAARRHPVANQGGDEEKISGGASTASATSERAAGKPGQGPQEDEEAMTRKLKRPIRKHRTVAVAAAASQPGGAKEPEHAGLRRSKRIVNRK